MPLFWRLLVEFVRSTVGRGEEFKEVRHLEDKEKRVVAIT
jgi:hypothetical protein